MILMCFWYWFIPLQFRGMLRFVGFISLWLGALAGCKLFWELLWESILGFILLWLYRRFFDSDLLSVRTFEVIELSLRQVLLFFSLKHSIVYLL
jgi:hypothetical protein